MSTNIEKWDVEDQQFWESTGKSIAYRNLWISIPSLLLGFAIWLMWGIITVQMSNLGFPFSKDELFTLTAIAGLSGATLRIPSSFFIRIAGGRNTIFLTTALLMIPAFGTGLALQSKETPLIMFQLLALLSGIGGGNFACSMSNISTFFPKRLQGTALGLNAGLGNFGVTTMQILIPLVMTAGIFGAFAGGSMELIKDSGWILGKITAGTQTYVQNAGFVWMLALIPLAFLGWFGMNNLLPITPGLGGSISAMIKVLWLYGLAFVTAGVGLYLYLPAPTGLGLLNMWVALPLIMVGTLFVMKLAAFGEMKGNIAVSCVCPGPTPTNFSKTARREDGTDTDRGGQDILRIPPEKVVSTALEALQCGDTCVYPGLGVSLAAPAFRIMPRFIQRLILRRRFANRPTQP